MTWQNNFLPLPCCLGRHGPTWSWRSWTRSSCCRTPRSLPCRLLCSPASASSPVTWPTQKCARPFGSGSVGWAESMTSSFETCGWPMVVEDGWGYFMLPWKQTWTFGCMFLLAIVALPFHSFSLSLKVCFLKMLLSICISMMNHSGQYVYLFIYCIHHSGHLFFIPCIIYLFECGIYSQDVYFNDDWMFCIYCRTKIRYCAIQYTCDTWHLDLCFCLWKADIQNYAVYVKSFAWLVFAYASMMWWVACMSVLDYDHAIEFKCWIEAVFCMDFMLKICKWPIPETVDF